MNLDVIAAEGWIMWADYPTEEIDRVMSEIPYINYYKTENYPFGAKTTMAVNRVVDYKRIIGQDQEKSFGVRTRCVCSHV